MAGIADKVYALVKDTVENQEVELWDVRYVKEGASYYLRIYIDKPDGVSINDCTNVSHAIDPIIEEADPIESSYYLEVCSAGLNRELIRDKHFETAIGKTIRIKLFKAVNGNKEYLGKLIAFEDGSLTVETDGGVMTFPRKDIAKVNTEDI